MGYLWKYALRNLARQRTRTALTVLAVALGVGLVMVGGTFLDGIGEDMIAQFARTTGHVRLRHPDYEKESRFNPLEFNIQGYRALREKLVALPDARVKAVLPRLTFRAMVQYTDESTIVPADKVEDESKLTDEQIFGRKVLEFAPGLGVDPALEQSYDRLDQKLIDGRYFSGQDVHEVLIGKELARRLGVKPGHELQLVSYRKGVSDTGVKVAGIFDSGNRYQNRLCYLPIGVAEDLLDLKDETTELLVFTDSYKASPALFQAIQKAGLASNLEAKQWDQIGIFKTIVRVFAFIMALIMGAIITVAAVGLLNTMLMTVLERQREIGLLLALGIARRRVVTAFMSEALLIAIIGCVVGLAGGLLGSWYFVEVGISVPPDATKNFIIAMPNTIKGVLTWSSVAWSVGTGFSIAILGALWPSFRASGVQPLDAMRRG